MKSRVCIAIYGLAASILPVWMLLCPRDYLSSFMKLGTIAFLIIGVFVVHPDLKMPAFSQFVDGGGPIIPGKLFPFVFITIACGAISGFHALVGSGTTPKMISLESHIRPIGYGAMLMEGVVGVVSLIAASALYPGDYFAINVMPEKFSQLGMSVVNLPELEREVGEIVTGRPGGAVSLAVGMAQIFTAIPGMKGLMSYWYHFAIMFEALFILTTIDTGTRVARFLVQEFLGKFYKPMERTDWMPGTIFSSVLVVAGWSYFIFTGQHQHHLADVWNRQPTAGGYRTLRGNNPDCQLGAGAAGVGHTASAIVRFHDNADRGVQKHYRQLHASGTQRGSVGEFSGAIQRGADDHHDDVHDHHPVRFHTEVAQGTLQRKSLAEYPWQARPAFRNADKAERWQRFHSLNSRLVSVPAASSSDSPKPSQSLSILRTFHRPLSRGSVPLQRSPASLESIECVCTCGT